MTQPRLNPDGVSAAGASAIYAPKGQALEYAALATNPYRGCGHRCAYCYVPTGKAEGIDPDVQTHGRLGAVPNLTRAEFDAGAVLKPGYLERLEKDARKYQALGVTEQVLMCFSTDPYHPGDTTPTRRVIEVLQSHGLGVCILTKGGSRTLRDIDLFRPDRDAFAASLTSLDTAFSRKWERAAADPDDRIATLRAFHERGIFTWVSLEPTLDVEASLAIVDATHGFVDLYKVGRVNYIGLTKTTDWRSYTLRMIEKLTPLGKAHYIKKDLQPYLPAGYPNPLRVAQYRT